MLATLDRLLAPLTWIAATVAVVALLVGPEVIGARRGSPRVPAGGHGHARGR